MIGHSTPDTAKHYELLRLPPTMLVNGNGTPQRPLSTPTSLTGNGKMNGSLLHIRHSAPTPVVGAPATALHHHNHSLNTSKLQGFDLSARELFVAQHSLHDTSLQELSRSMLIGGSGGGGITRMRTPNTPSTPTLGALHTSPGPGTPINPGGSAVSSASSPSPPNAGGSPSLPQNSMCAPRPPFSPLRLSLGRDQASPSVNELLASLALLSTVSLLLAFLAVLVLLKVMGQAALVSDGCSTALPCNSSGLQMVLGGGSRVVDSGEYKLVYDVVIGLTTCTISLDFTCLLICCAQFIFASKLAKAPHGRERAIQYLRHSSFSRVIAIGGFFISIPVLLTGIILYAFIQFESKSAIITSLALGLSIVFCGLAMIHNVYVWQQEKTKFVVARLPAEELLKVRSTHSEHNSSQGFDLTHNASLELSTLV